MNDDLIAARIDRLRRSGLHRHLLILVAFSAVLRLRRYLYPALGRAGAAARLGIGVPALANLISVSFLGMFLGALESSALSDRIGRRRALISYVTVASIASVLTAAAPDMHWLLVSAQPGASTASPCRVILMA